MLAILATRTWRPAERAQRVEQLDLTYLDHDQRVTVVDYIACGDNDFRDRPCNVGQHGDLHLHRFQDHHWFVGSHCLSHFDLDLHNGRDEFGDDCMAHAVIVGFAGEAFR
jgi:hypothetical protein